MGYWQQERSGRQAIVSKRGVVEVWMVARGVAPLVVEEKFMEV